MGKRLGKGFFEGRLLENCLVIGILGPFTQYALTFILSEFHIQPEFD